MLVRGVVVDYEVDVQARRHAVVDVAQEGEELLVLVLAFTLREHCTGGDVLGGEQCRDAMADMVVAHTFDVAKPHSQHGPGAI